MRQALNPNAPSGASGRQSSVVPTNPAGGAANKGRTPSAEVPANNNISNDRAKLGLGLKPSEMIAGLDDYAKRVEKQEEREEAKRKAGGKISQNEALKVDDTGKRWQRNVILGLVGIAVVVGVVVIVMAFFANIDKIDPKIANRNTRDMLTQLVGFSQRIPTGEADASSDRIKDLLREQIDQQLKQVDADIERDEERRKKENKHRPPDNRLYRERETLVELRKFQDVYGQPFIFSVSNGELTISAKGKPEGGPIEPVVARLPGAGTPKPAEKVPESPK